MSRLIKPRFLLVLALTAVLTAALACASEDDPTAAPTAPAARAAPAAPAVPTPDAAARAKAVAEAELTELVVVAGQRVEIPKRVAPAAALAGTAVGEQTISTANAGLGNIKPYAEGGRNRTWMTWVFMPAFLYDNKNELVQGFATAYTLSEDGKTLTLHINPDATWNDGSKLTADEVKLAWEWGMRPDQVSGWGGTPRYVFKALEGGEAAAAGETEDVTGITALDAETIQVQYIERVAVAPFQFSNFLTGVFKPEGAEELGEEYWLAPVGLGPYSHTAAPQENITMVATPNYWEEQPIVTSHLALHIAEPSTQLLMFENGDLDTIYARPGLQPTVHDPSHPMNPYVRDMPYSGLSMFVRYNTAREPFQDINVRKALAHAINMDKIVPAVFGAAGHRGGGGILQEDLRCYDPNFKPWSYDPEAAKMYLSQSEYKTGDKVPTIKIQSRPGSTQFNLVMQAWQEAWKDNLGVEFKITLVETGGEIPPDMNMRIASSGAGIPDPVDFMSRVVHTRGTGQMHINDELDALMETAEAMNLDDPGRCDIAQKIDREFMEQYYIVPIIRVDYMFLAQPWVLGWETSVNNDIATLPFVKIGVKDRSRY